MQKTIKLYETPDMKVFEMHAEGVMCQSFGDEGRAGTKVITDDYYDLTKQREKVRKEREEKSEK